MRTGCLPIVGNTKLTLVPVLFVVMYRQGKSKTLHTWSCICLFSSEQAKNNSMKQMTLNSKHSLYLAAVLIAFPLFK